MRIATAGLLGLSTLLVAACSAAPGSPEWCKAAMEGTIKPSEQEQQQYAMQCMGHLMKDAIGSMKMPGQ